jgi:hypothetical protein
MGAVVLLRLFFVPCFGVNFALCRLDGGFMQAEPMLYAG